MKRLICILMAALMLFAVAGCNKDENGGGNDKVKLENVYGSEYIKLPEGVQSVESIATSGDTVFLVSYKYTETDYGQFIYAVPLNGGEAKVIYEVRTENENQEENVYRSRNISGRISIDASGNLWFNESNYYEDNRDPENYVFENTSKLMCIDPSGNVVRELKMEELGEEYTDFYINGMTFDDSGNCFLSNYSSLLVLDSSLKPMFKIDEDNGIDSLTKLAGGEIMAQVWGESGIVGKVVDMAAKGWRSEDVKLPTNASYGGYTSSAEYSFCYNTSNAIFGYDVASGESTEVLNWINSDINAGRVNSIVSLKDGRFAAVEMNEDYSQASLLLLTKKNPEDIVEKTILNLASVYLNDNLRNYVIKFNKSNDEYRVQVVDYSKYNTEDDYMASYNQLNYDIISGNIPDIISLSNLPYGNYVAKGLLVDINKLIDEDETVNRADYLENVFKAAEINGGLYELIPVFYANTVVGKTANVGDKMGWTLDELEARLRAMPEGAQAFSDMGKSAILQASMIMNMGQFVDQATGKCSFNTDAFIKLLEFANANDSALDWETMNQGGEYDQQFWTDYENQYREDRTMLSVQYVGNFGSYRNMTNTFGGEVTLIGFPCENGGIGAGLAAELELGISSKTKHQDGCWQFLKYFLSDDFQDNVSYNFPISKKALQKQLDKAMEPVTDRWWEDGGVGIVDGRYTYEYSELSQEEADKMMRFIESLDQVMRLDEKLFAIIEEESGAFFAGQRSAKEVADVIQSRAQVYINENR